MFGIPPGRNCRIATEVRFAVSGDGISLTQCRRADPPQPRLSRRRLRPFEPCPTFCIPFAHFFRHCCTSNASGRFGQSLRCGIRRFRPPWAVSEFASQPGQPHCHDDARRTYPRAPASRGIPQRAGERPVAPREDPPGGRPLASALPHRDAGPDHGAHRPARRLGALPDRRRRPNLAGRL